MIIVKFNMNNKPPPIDKIKINSNSSSLIEVDVGFVELFELTDVIEVFAVGIVVGVFVWLTVVGEEVESVSSSVEWVELEPSFNSAKTIN